MVIELVTFKTREGVQESDFARAAESADKFLLTCKGFRQRRLANRNGCEWLDYVEWDSMQDALDAANAFGKVPETSEFNAAIDPGSVIMRHFEIRSAASR